MSNLQPLGLGEEKRQKERRKKPQDENIMSAPAAQDGHKKWVKKQV